jgi:cardiolipin synthase
MMTPLKRQRLLDLSHEPLGPGWLRHHPTTAEQVEERGRGVWCTGPQTRFRRQLIEALGHANELVLVCSFLLAERELADAMLLAAKRGVRVYVLTASDQSIAQFVRDDDEFAQRMLDEHKGLLAELAGRVCLRSAAHIHAKFMVVDPKLAGVRGWLSTANFNKALTDGIELGIELDAELARTLAAYFQWAFWCEATHELRGPRRLAEVTRRHPAVPPRPSHPRLVATMTDEQRLRDAVMQLIDGARERLVIASYGLDVGHPTIDALCRAARRGVSVTVLTRPRPPVAAAVRTLAAAGVKVRAHDKLHAKAIVADDRALVMTANLEAGGLDRGFEIGVLLNSEQSKQIHQILEDWSVRFPWTFSSDTTRGQFLGDFCPVESRLRDGIVQVTQGHAQSLAPKVAKDARQLDRVEEPAFVVKVPANELPRAVTFSWEVQPPKIPKQARERLRTVERTVPAKPGAKGNARTISEQVSYDPPVYEHGKLLYVKLREPAELDAAGRLADELGATVAL